MSGVSAIEPLLDLIYDAPLHPDGWERMVDGLTRALGARGAALMFQDWSQAAPQTHPVTTTGYPDEAEHVYNAHFAHRDDRLSLLMRSRPGRLIADVRDLDHAAYVATPIFNDFYRRYGMECGVGVKLFGDHDRIGMMSIFREVGRGSYSDAEIQLLARVTPHLMRALQLKRRLDRANAVSDGLLSGLDCFDQAVLLLGPSGRVVEMNAAAETLLCLVGCPLSIRERQLFTAQPDDTVALRRTIAEAVAGAEHGRSAPPAILQLSSRDHAMTLGLMAVPVRRGIVRGAGPSQGVLLFISASRPARSLDLAVVARQFGLSPAEAQIAAALAAGRSVNDIADQRTVSRETVRAQVKTILAKTGLSAQGPLVALLTRSLAALRRF